MFIVTSRQQPPVSRVNGVVDKLRFEEVTPLTDRA